MPRFRLKWPFSHGRKHEDGSVTITQGGEGDEIELTDEEAAAVQSDVLEPVKEKPAAKKAAKKE